AVHHLRQTELHAISGDLAQKLPPTPNHEIAAADGEDPAELYVDRMRFIEEVPIARFERAEFATEHRFANEAIAVAVSVESLFGAVVDARDAHARHQERQRRQGPSAALMLTRTFIVREPRLVRSLAHLIVIVECGHDLVAEPGMGVFAHEQRIPE